MRRSCFRVAAACGVLLGLTGCRPHRIEATLINQTGGNIRLVEVDYPTGSIGANALAPGENLANHIQLHGSGPIRIQYLAGSATPVTLQGPVLREGQQGKLTILLLPAGQAEFRPELSPAP